MLTIHRASAGSGKTFTLAYEYIKLLLGYKDTNGIYHLNEHAKGAHRHILAITFTNKATGEMKHRIIHELALLSDTDGSSAYLDKLAQEFNVEPVKIQRAATDALQSLLNDFSNFNISTIDSFFQNILRTFAREAEVPYNYDIELQDKYAVKVGINDLLSSLKDSGNKQLLTWLKRYMRNQIDSDSSWNIFAENKFGRGKSLYQLAENLGNEAFKEHREELETYLEDKTRITQFQQTLTQAIEQNYRDIKQAADDFQDYLVNHLGIPLNHVSSRGGLYGFRKILAEGARTKLPAGFSTALEAPDKWFLKSKVKGFNTLDPKIERYINRILTATESNNTYRVIVENLYALGLLGDISRHLFKFRTDNNLILLSDTNELLRRIINDDDTPFIYERVGLRLKHFLIDEFQDTSRMQWDNMKPLLSESLGELNDNLIIGDEKQSIYRFRNADPSLLQTEVAADFHGYIPSDTPAMQTNWRSSRNVIEFNNQLFADLSHSLEHDTTYANIKQHVSPKNIASDPGYVELNFMEETDDNSWEEQVLKELPERIIDMLSRGLKQSDIAILVNKNEQGARVIERLFQHNRNTTERANIINIVSDESLKLKNSPAVRLIVGMLKHINSTAAGTPKEQISTLLKEYEYAIATGTEPSSALSHGIETIQSQADTIATELTDIYSSSLISITEHIISRYVNSDTRKAENAYIQAFQDCIIDYSSRNTPTVHHFLKWWESNKDMLTVTSPATTDAINVMTIHKSKGLEFASVIIPFTDWEMDSGRGYIWQQVKLDDRVNIPDELIPPIIPLDYKKDLANTLYREEYEQISRANTLDTLNKTYVAFTRAAQELLIYTPAEFRKGYISEYLATRYASTTYILGENKPTYNQPQTTTGQTELIEDYPVSEQLPKLHFTLPDTLIETPRERGIMLHRIFSLIEYTKDVNTVIAQVVADGIIPSGEQQQILTLITTAINHSELTRSWFSEDKQVLMERSILTDGTLKRPDRIVIDRNTGAATIIDYKFGTQHPKKYERQLSEYANLLNKAGFTNVISYLWYPDGEIQKIT